mmetsp:Transcript_41344/g.110634  ORF Transcript_41344/g.110634 Transcript_41344/m.110634 type:complete len:140 (-) Transcript_41344:144-563(-)
MTQIALVADQHNDNVLIRVISQLLQPSIDVLKGNILRNIVDEECPNSTTIICAGNSSVSLLSSGIPNLRFQSLSIHLNAPCRKLCIEVGEHTTLLSSCAELTSTPIVLLDSRLNSFLVNLERRFDLPTPESPIKTTLKR